MMGLLREEGITAGRFKVRRLMSELGLICKQPGPHAYKQATVERIDIPNHLAREFVFKTGQKDDANKHGISKAGSVTFDKVDNAGRSNDYTVVYIDNDRDRGSEMAIKLVGLHDLTVSDFIL